MTLSIASIILHQMDHIAERLVLSDLTTTMNPATSLALGKQVVTNRDHKRAQRFAFDSATPNVVNDAFGTILQQPDDERIFIAQSRIVAVRLYETIRGNKNVSVGDLLLCLFREDGGDPWLAILKMQPESAYVRRVEGDQAAHTLRVVLEVTDQTLTSGVLQKSAFLLPPALRRDDHAITVLDQQADQRGENKIALFFLKDFLQCQVAPTERQMTVTFLRGTRKFAAERGAEWPLETRESLSEVLPHIEYGQEVDVEGFARSHIPAPDREEYVAFLDAQGLPTHVFVPQPPRGRAKVRYKYFEGDNGLLVRIEEDAWGAGKTVEEQAQPEGGQTIVRIRTTLWRDVTEEHR